jgi:hypothetical protein
MATGNVPTTNAPPITNVPSTNKPVTTVGAPGTGIASMATGNVPTTNAPPITNVPSTNKPVATVAIPGVRNINVATASVPIPRTTSVTSAAITRLRVTFAPINRCIRTPPISGQAATSVAKNAARGDAGGEDEAAAGGTDRHERTRRSGTAIDRPARRPSPSIERDT